MAHDDRDETPKELEAKLDELVRMGREQVDFTRWLSAKVDDIHRRIVASDNPMLPRNGNGDGR